MANKEHLEAGPPLGAPFRETMRGDVALPSGIASPWRGASLVERMAMGVGECSIGDLSVSLLKTRPRLAARSCIIELVT